MAAENQQAIINDEIEANSAKVRMISTFQKKSMTMDIYGVSQAALDLSALKGMDKLCADFQTAQFQSYVDDLQMRADMMEHLKGVPLEAIYIAPSILQKMKNNPSVYNYYMEKLDGFVGEYKNLYSQPMTAVWAGLSPPYCVNFP